MMKRTTLIYKFVKYIPDCLEYETIYVSIPFATVAHRCCCGCGKEVIIPLSPTDWRLIFDGQSISLEPSIGNWNFSCKSHYWIKQNEAIFVPQWTQEQIQHGRNQDLIVKKKYYGDNNTYLFNESYEQTLWGKVKRWLLSLFTVFHN